MRSRTVLGLGALVVAGALVALAVLSQSAPHGAENARFHFAFPTGTRLDYTLRWQLHQRAAALAVPNSDGAAALDFAGTLRLVSHGPHAGGWLLEATVDFERHELAVAGRELLSDDAAVARELGARRAFLELDGDGTVRAVSFLPDATPTWRNLATTLFGALEVVLPADGAASWTLTQAAPFGRAVTSYEHDGAGLGRRRTAYVALDALAGAPPPIELAATGAVQLDAGHLTRLDDDETIAVRAGARELLAGEAHLHLELRAAGTATPAPVALTALERRRPGERVVDPALERAALEARVDGLTVDQFLADMIGLGDVGVPDQHRWMWRAAALLELHPELCGALVAPFKDGRLGRHGGALALDLLASARTPAAQAAMRAMLGSPAAHAIPGDYILLVQRFAFVDHPDADTLAFLRTIRRGTADADIARAAAYALGNAGDALARHGDDVASTAIVRELTADLAAAHSSADRAALIGALSATHSAAAADTTLALASDGDPIVRAAAARALAGDPRASTGATALVLAGDADANVQSVALAALAERRLDGVQLAALAALPVAPINMPNWLGVVGSQLRVGSDPAVFRAALERLATGGVDARIRTAARQLLASR